MELPILLIGFQRPSALARLLAALEQVSHKRLYVFVDGPFDGDLPGQVRNREIRSLVTEAGRRQRIQMLFSAKNLGLMHSVPAAIDWFFTYESEGVILEDDCWPDPTFFRFVADALQAFRENREVASISGFNMFAGVGSTSSDVLFSRYPSVWGWGTWKRAWEGFSPEVDDAARLNLEYFVSELAPDSGAHRRYWFDRFVELELGTIKTWDYQWMLHCLRKGMLHAYYRQNLIQNFGSDSAATNPQNGLRRYLLSSRGDYAGALGKVRSQPAWDGTLEKYQRVWGFGAASTAEKIGAITMLPRLFWSRAQAAHRRPIGTKPARRLIQRIAKRLLGLSDSD